MQPDDQGREKRKKNPAANEVLSEIHNAVCTALKDFSRGGVFLYRPQQKCGQGGWGSWLWGLPCWANCANNSSLTSRLHSIPHSTAVKYASRSTLSEPVFSASLRTMEWVPQLEGCCLYLLTFKLQDHHKSRLCDRNHNQPHSSLRHCSQSFGHFWLETHCSCGPG